MICYIIMGLNNETMDANIKILIIFTVALLTIGSSYGTAYSTGVATATYQTVDNLNTVEMKRHTQESFFNLSYPCPVTGCWIIGNKLTAYGYCMVSYQGEIWIAHRLAFKLNGGILPTTRNEVIAHKCDVKSCINPDHLERISNAKNVQDAFTRKLRTRKFSEQDIIDIKNKHIPYKYSEYRLAKEYNTARTYIHRILTGERRKHG